MRKLDKPPILEALLDFRVVPGTESEGGRFDILAEVLAETYPGVQPPVRVTHLGSSDSESFKTVWAGGYRFSSNEGEKRLLATSNQFTFSHTFSPKDKPYSSWQKFFDEARFAWQSYERALEPHSLVRVGTRFVNKFETSTEQALKVFKSPILSPLEDSSTHRYRDTLTGSTKDDYGFRTGRRIEPTGASQRVVIFFDVEAFKALDVSCPVDFAWLEPDIARLRNIKNDLFFNSLTENTLARFSHVS